MRGPRGDRRNGDSPRKGIDTFLFSQSDCTYVTVEMGIALLLLLCSEKSSVGCALPPEKGFAETKRTSVLISAHWFFVRLAAHVADGFTPFD